MERKTHVLLFRWMRSHHFIVTMATCAFMGFIIAYAVSVGTGKVNALFPYISDTGTTPPASCVFGLALNLAAMFTIVIMYIRHGHFQQYNAVETLKIHKINDVSMFLGLLSAFGVMLVACFQLTELKYIHLIGAFLVFVLGIVYCYLQSYLTFATIGSGFSTRHQAVTRFTLSIIATLAFVMTFVALVVSSAEKKGHIVNILKWKSTDPGYAAHLISTFSEWIMAICFIFFFVTYYREFKDVEPSVCIQRKPCMQIGRECILEDLSENASERQVLTKYGAALLS